MLQSEDNELKSEFIKIISTDEKYEGKKLIQ